MEIMGESRGAGRWKGLRRAVSLGESLLLRTGRETQVIKEGVVAQILHGKNRKKGEEAKTAGNRKERGREEISVPEHRTASLP